MRLISMDGKNDFPYEMSLVYTDETKVEARFDYNWGWTIGVFDTEEKAVNELKKIRTAYASGRMIYKIGE